MGRKLAKEDEKLWRGGAKHVIVKFTMLKACERRLTEEYPDRAVAWYAVGCYYLAAGQNEAARRYFGKATALDPTFAPGWSGVGHAFAAMDESDQVCQLTWCKAGFRMIWGGTGEVFMCMALVHIQSNDVGGCLSKVGFCQHVSFL